MRSADLIIQIVQSIKFGNLTQLNTLITKAINQEKESFNQIIEIGIECGRFKKIKEGIVVFQILKEFVKDDIRIPYNLGLLHSLLADHHSALKFYDEALLINPLDSETLINKSSALNEQKKFQLALDLFNEFNDQISHFPEAWLNRGVAYSGIGFFHDAIVCYDKAILLKPNYAEAFYNKAISLQKIKCFNEAIMNYDKAIFFKSDYAEAVLNKGNVFYALKNFNKAIENYDEALYLKPYYAEAMLNKGNVFYDLKEFNNAIALYENAFSYDPNINWLPGIILHSKMQSCLWDNFYGELNLIIKKIKEKNKVIMPFSLLSLLDNPKIQDMASKIYSKQISSEIPHSQFTYTREKNSEKIRLAYYSADFHNHATSYLLAETLELHDKNKFHLIGISFGPNTFDAMQTRLLSTFDEFIDTNTLTDYEVINLSRKLNIHIAIDLKGFTQHSRPNIFFSRVAPIQINYLGYPGTLGNHCYDYIIADRILIPNDLKKYYSEKIIYFPNCYQPNDRKKPISNRNFIRSDFNLPKDCFIFCSFNNNYKITPLMFDSWIRILKAVDNSVLWLLKDNAYCESNLKKIAINSGINAERLIFTDNLPLDEHLARHRLADLFLDTYPYNAHTTASDSLWSGLPLITLCGNSFASRVAASLLNSIGLNELIASTHQEYESLAIYLAQNPIKLNNIKHRLIDNKLIYPLFNTPLYVQNLESAFRIVTDKFFNNQEIDHIYL